jgi:hypothetical protein
MNSTKLLNKIETSLKELEHKDYCKVSFKNGYLIGFCEGKSKQSKKHSIIESVFNVIAGLIISFVIQLIIYPILNIPVSINQNLIITFVFFVASFVRGYLIRRLFNKL